jgi:hypothetical protein
VPSLHAIQGSGIFRSRKAGTRNCVIHNQGGEVKIGDTKHSVKLAQSIDVESKAKVLRLSVLGEGEDKVYTRNG